MKCYTMYWALFATLVSTCVLACRTTHPEVTTVPVVQRGYGDGDPWTQPVLPGGWKPEPDPYYCTIAAEPSILGCP